MRTEYNMHLLSSGISEQCRQELSSVRGQEGSRTLSIAKAHSAGAILNVSDDLLGFTGLSEADMMKRLRREGVFHFETVRHVASRWKTVPYLAEPNTPVDVWIGRIICQCGYLTYTANLWAVSIRQCATEVTYFAALFT